MGIFSSREKRKPSKPDARIDQHDKAVYDLKVQRDRLNKYIANVRIWG
jgi:hypothetical protein